MTIEELKSTLTIPLLWDKLGLPGSIKPGQVVPCPWKNSSRKCFSISMDGRLWHDFSNSSEKEGGSCIDFLMIHLGLDQQDAIKKAHELLGVEMSDEKPVKVRPIIEPVKRRMKPEPKGSEITDPSLTEQLILSLSELRGIKPDAIKRVFKNGCLSFWQEDGNILWAVHDKERLCIQMRRMDGKPFKSGAKGMTVTGSWATWPVGLLSEDKRKVILVEGGPDFLAAHQLLPSYDVIGMLGAAMKIHPGFIPLLLGRKVVITPHNDEAGSEAAEKWSKQLAESSIQYSIRELPEDIKDINDYVKLKKGN